MQRVVIGFVFIVLATSAQAEVLWRGNFDTGNLTQWPDKETVGTDRLQVVTSPVKEGSHALQVTVKPGDLIFSGARNELVYYPSIPEGSERFYKWSTLWPVDYVSPDTWHLFLQFHHTGSNGSPPVEMVTRGEQMSLTTNASGGGGTVHWKAPLARGVWHEFVLHVKWSSDASVGFLELYYDGERVLPKKNVATLFPGMTNYLKQGLYRDKAVNVTQTLFHDGTMEATELADVFPVQQPPVVVDAGQPVPVPVPVPVDAGAPVVADAGVGTPPKPPVEGKPVKADAGTVVVADAGAQVVEAPAEGDVLEEDDAQPRAGCSSTSTGTPAFLFLSVLVLMLARRP